MEEILTRVAFFLTGQKYAPPSVPGLLDAPTRNQELLANDCDSETIGDARDAEVKK